MALTDSLALYAHSSTGEATATQLDPHDTVTAQHDSTSLVHVSDALGNSPLGRLPPEIRNLIYAMTLAQPHGTVGRNSAWLSLENGAPLSQALNIRSTCKQIRDETERMFFDLNEITIYSACTYQNPTGTWPHMQKSVDVLNSIPLTSISNSSKVIVWLDRTLLPSSIPQFSRVAQGIHRFQVFFGVLSRVHPWSGGFDGLGLGNPTSGGLQPYPVSCMSLKPLCPRAPDSMIDCARFELVFPIRDRTTALKMIEDLYQYKISLVEAHRSHRLCPIRCELERLLQSFVEARQELIDLVQLACV